MGNGGFRVEKPAAVGKGVGRDVHHAHHQGLAEVEPVTTGDQNAHPYAAGCGATTPSAPSEGGLEAVPAPPLGLGGRGGRPAMMSFTCSESSRSEEHTSELQSL